MSHNIGGQVIKNFPVVSILYYQIEDVNNTQ